MADDPKQRGGSDRKRIDVSQEHECRYWAAKFKVSPYEVREAVKAVGPIVDDVATRPRWTHTWRCLALCSSDIATPEPGEAVIK